MVLTRWRWGIQKIRTGNFCKKMHLAWVEDYFFAYIQILFKSTLDRQDSVMQKINEDCVVIKSVSFFFIFLKICALIDQTPQTSTKNLKF